ncbi:MAG: hypothetical protein LC799_29485 [Actinobacteria bacterium]|nr:hypothetical protein [Actinomycetota bacterium]
MSLFSCSFGAGPGQAIKAQHLVQQVLGGLLGTVESFIAGVCSAGQFVEADPAAGCDHDAGPAGVLLDKLRQSATDPDSRPRNAVFHAAWLSRAHVAADDLDLQDQLRATHAT